ncbi:DUF2490 domain-containing protein [Gaoshiqia sp. Z1-71]|uniref:DUF2490 domain-containing protein n=1 Tax=Gaoshiqia hydrogeniformans TaxID=3290090 RepID=UPI003BF8DFEE
MNNHFLKLYTVLSCLLFLTSSYAQSHDFGAWFTAGAEKKIKNWSFYLGEELRTMQQSGTIERLKTDLDIQYKLSKTFKLGASYQFIYFHDVENDDYQPRNRYNFFVQGKKGWNRFTFSLRERLQSTWKDETVRDYKMNPKNSWRNRLEMEYNIPKSPLTPSFLVETFYQLNNPDGNRFDKIRYKLAGAYKLNKRNRLELFGAFDKEINVKNPVQRFVLGLEYKYDFKKN